MSASIHGNGDGLGFLSKHLAVFSRSVDAALSPDDIGGKRGRAFGAEIQDVCLEFLPEGQIERSKVFELASRPEVSDLTVCAAIMAWGGMRANNRDALFDTDTRTEWLKVARKIRCGKVDRKTAYSWLSKLKLEGKLKGAGPAYFTKLIYFLMPRDGTASKAGHIMDQWAGCSINVLTDREVVLMNISKNWKRAAGPAIPSYDFTVSDENTAANYEAFCCAIDRLAIRYNINADQIDRALASDGGRNPKPWRKYVMDRRCQHVLHNVDHYYCSDRQ